MGWAERTQDGGWRACWRTNEGRRRSKSGFTSKAAAKRHAGKEEMDARRGLLDSQGRAPKWGKWRDDWLLLRNVEPSTERQDVVRINRHLTPKWGNVRLNQITRSAVQAWVNDLGRTPAAGRTDPLSPSTVDRILALFSASMKAAVLDDRLPVTVNPCTGVKKPTPAPGHERYLTRGEADLIAHHLNEPYRAAWLVLCGTGMRFGELAGLHWERVDLDHRLIHVSMTWDSADGVMKPYPKSKKPRSVPIPDWLEPVLAGLMERQGKPATSCRLPHRGGPKCRSGLVVPNRVGGALDGHNFGSRDFAQAVTLSGLGSLRLHDARHTYASWLVQAGVPLQEVQRLLGHASIVTTQRYSHLGTSQNEAVLKALSRTPQSESESAPRHE